MSKDDDPPTRFVGKVSPLATDDEFPDDDGPVRCGVGLPAPETIQGVGPRPGQTLSAATLDRAAAAVAGQTLPSAPAPGVQPEALARWIGERLSSDVIGRHLRDLTDVRKALVGALVERYGLPEATVRQAVTDSSHELAGNVHVDARSLARRLNDLGAGT